MSLVLVFILGVANFAMHRGVVESGHPVLRQLPSFWRAMGGRAGLVLEYAVLVAAMMFSQSAGPVSWPVIAYVLYTLSNALAAWMILSGRF